MASIKRDIGKVEELCCTIMVRNTREIGKLIRDMDMDSKPSQMEVHMKESTVKIKWKVKGSISGREVRFTRVSLIII